MAGFIPEFGPGLSIATTVTANTINDTVNAGLDVYYPVLRTEQMVNNISKTFGKNNVLNFSGLNNIDMKSILFTGFKTFFGD